MEKKVENLIIGIMGAGYLYIVTGCETSMADWIKGAFLFTQIFRIILSLCGFILVCSGLKTKMNRKADFMAISIMEISILLIMQLWMAMQDNPLLYAGRFFECNWLIEGLQIITLLICINYIEENTYIAKWSIAAISTCVLGIIFIFLKIPNSFESWQISSYLFWTFVKCVLGISSIAVIYFISYKKIQVMPKVEKRSTYALLIIKVVLYCCISINILFKAISPILLTMVLQVIFNFISIIYIQELTVGVFWKSIDSGVQAKNEELIKGYIEQRTLVKAAQAIHKDIESINNKTLELEKKLLEKHNQKSEKYIEKIKNNCHRLLKLSDNILELNSYESGKKMPKFEYLNMSTLIEAIVESLETYVNQKGIEIKYVSIRDDIMAEVERDSIERILLNLISNAVKYNVDNGKIEVLLGERRKRVYICVKDTGIGIPNNLQKSIFEKFKRVNSTLTKQQEGSGLGLSIVKTLVELHEGEIKIASKEGRGTLISIELPKVQRKRKGENGWCNLDTNHLDEKILVEFSDLETCKVGGK